MIPKCTCDNPDSCCRCLSLIRRIAIAWPNEAATYLKSRSVVRAAALASL